MLDGSDIILIVFFATKLEKYALLGISEHAKLTM